MNLMKLFNLNYLKQNLKKSKAILSIFIGLIPILNTIILLMIITTNNDNYVLDFFNISIINLIGIYILPIIISICLFNYIYKKKSVDFINSMPISRKSIFITNIIAGIIIFTLMQIINVILTLLISNIFNINIPIMMLVDYFWFFLLVYIYCFSITNVAMSISGNAITQIIVTLIITFIIPFINSYYYNFITKHDINSTLIECNNTECIPQNYYCYGDIECNLNKNLNRYIIRLEKIENNNYTTPYALLYGSVINNYNIINTTSVIKMLILSIIYIILGYYLFINRKMEVSETSFKSIHTHNLIKSLTMIPIMAIAYNLLKKSSLVFIIFIIIIMLIYYFIYDLITRKNLQNIKISLLYFVITIIILTCMYETMDNNDKEQKILKYSDINSVAVDIEKNSNNFNQIYIKDKEIISLIVKEILNEKDSNPNKYIKIFLKTKNNKEYKTYLYLSDDKYEKLIEVLSNKEEYINYYKKIDINKIYALKLGDKLYNKKESQKYLKLINDSLNKLSFKEYVQLQNKYNNVSNEYLIKLYTYDNHNKREITINSYINYNLLNSIVNSNNRILKENITKDIPKDYTLYYSDSYIENNDNEIDYFVLKSAKKDIYKFILKEINKEVDIRKEYISLQIDINYNTYKFTTNNTKEFFDILLDTYNNNIKYTEEYNSYSREIEYYD